jgi:hypothetical protein
MESTQDVSAKVDEHELQNQVDAEDSFPIENWYVDFEYLILG